MSNIIDTPFVKLFDKGSGAIEYNCHRERDVGTDRRHCFLTVDKNDSETSQVWLNDSQLKQLYFAIGQALLCDKFK